MKYAIKHQQWELTDKEKEKARFILDFCDTANTRLGRSGKSEISSVERNAFDLFKAIFYAEVVSRLSIPAASYSLPDGYAFQINDALQLEGYKVEPVDEE